MADNKPKIITDYPPSIRDSAPSPTNSVASASSAVNPFPHDLPGLYERAFKVAEQAVLEDQQGRYEVARALYLQINQIFADILQLEQNPASRHMLMQKSQEYSTRVEQLSCLLDTAPVSPDMSRRLSPTLPSDTPLSPAPRPKSQLDLTLERAQFSLDQAILHDEKHNNEDALELYLDAADWFLKAYKESTDEAYRLELRSRFTKTVDRAEELKATQKTQVSMLAVQSGNMIPPRSASPAPGSTSNVKPAFTASSPTDVIGHMGVVDLALARYTPQEIALLKMTSKVNGRLYLPWDNSDLKEKFSFREPFVDPDGALPLSDKQKSRFGGWKRPLQIMSHPRMIHQISSSSIIQDIVTDCSFVASLCVSAAYERRFKKQLITACIYPQNKSGQPCYNPSGKYMIKLHYNGIPRKVVVDDFLPVSRDGTLMCTFSTNKEELWPSIIEKAYMKLMGGYDFPGSNSGIDLHTLTGWIPEHIFIKDKHFMPDNVWMRILDGQKYGDALITIATGELTDANADTLGLVPTHAYAVLDICEKLGRRLLQVKNPWSHKRWTGPFSHLDTASWTSDLMRALNYDYRMAAQKDDGIFWIDFESICNNFDSIHMNWNPELFKYKSILHSPWPSDLGPKKDIYNLGYNPQFSLEVIVADAEPAAVFLLLSKHITMKEENKDYITLHLYDGTDGERVYYPGKPMKEGMYVNSPHILVRFNAPQGTSRYTIVISQHEKSRSLNFTLRAYCMSVFQLMEVPKKYLYEQKIPGQWTEQTAGGNISNASYMNNPQWRITIPAPSGPMPSGTLYRANAILMLEAPRAYAVHITLVQGGKRVTSVSTKDIIVQSGDYRHGFCYCEVPDLRIGEYTIVVSTFEAGLLGQFFLTVSCSTKFTTMPIPLEGAGMFSKALNGEWIIGVSAMGCPTNGSYNRNPRYLLEVKELTTVRIRLQTPQIKPIPPTNVTIFERGSAGKSFGKELATSGPYTNVIQGVATNDVVLTPNDRGYVIVASTWEKDIAGRFVAFVYSDRPVGLNRLYD